MRYVITWVLLSLSFLSHAQTQALINYQGVARDSKGTPLANQAISLKFEILQGSAGGPVVYTDNQPSNTTGISTNSLGLFSTQIGKNGTLGQVNWAANGPYFLQVSIDPAGGSNLIIVGTQQVVSVPIAMHVPSSFTNNVLTIGAKSHTLGSGVTITQGTGTNVTVSGGPNYTISSVSQVPVLALTPNNASLSIVGSNTIALPAAVTPTLVPSGIATVTNGASTYTVGVPSPNYNPVTSQLSFGSNNTLITPTLVLLNNSVLYSGTTSNSITLPAGITVASGSPSVSVMGGPNYTVSVTQPSLALTANSASISILGSNTIALPAAVTVSAPVANNLVTVTGGPNSYAVSVPLPTYNGTVLTIGANSTTVSPTLALTNGTLLTVGSNTVSFSSISPWRQGVGSVTLATSTDNVGINTPGAPAAKLDIYSNTSTSPILKVNNANVSNTSAALDLNSDGDISLLVNNTKSSGIAGKLFSTGGIALQVRNNSSSFAALQAQNTSSAAGAYAGYFLGGLSASGSGNTSSDFAFRAQNSSSSDLFVVRNDGNVGIGTNSPLGFLDVDVQSQSKDGIHIRNGRDVIGGSLPLSVEGTTSGQTYGTNTWGRILRLTNVTFNIFYDLGIDNSGTFFLSGNNVYTNPYFSMTNSGNIGMGTAVPAAKLDVIGSVKITDGTQGLGKVLVSNAAGTASWTSSPAATSFGNLNGASTLVSSSITTLVTSSMIFTKQYAATEMEISLYTNTFGGNFSGAGYIYFEIYVDGSPGSAATRRYFFTNSQTDYISLQSFFSGLTVGSHTISIIAQTSGITSTGVLLDPGGFGGKVLVKESF